MGDERRYIAAHSQRLAHRGDGGGGVLYPPLFCLFLLIDDQRRSGVFFLSGAEPILISEGVRGGIPSCFDRLTI